MAMGCEPSLYTSPPPAAAGRAEKGPAQHALSRVIANAASAAQTAFERFLEAARLQRLTEVTDSSQQRPA